MTPDGLIVLWFVLFCGGVGGCLALRAYPRNDSRALCVDRYEDVPEGYCCGCFLGTYFCFSAADVGAMWAGRIVRVDIQGTVYLGPCWVFWGLFSQKYRRKIMGVT